MKTIFKIKVASKIILILLFANTCLFSQDLANFSSAFVNIGFGAKPLGMGRAYTALANDANAILWNPAGIIEVKNFEATFSYSKHFGLIPYSFGSFVYSFDQKFALGTGAIISGDDLLKEISIISNIATRFDLHQYKINLGFTFSLHTASFGKNDSHNFAVQGDAIGFSAGGGFQMYLTENIIFASQIQNYISTITWNSSTIGKYSEGLPKRWSLGFGLKDFNQFNFDFDLNKSLYKEIEDEFLIGIERNLYQKAFLRGGVASSINKNDRIFYTLGGGLSHQFQRIHFQLDMAYIFHPLDNMLRLSLSFRLD